MATTPPSQFAAILRRSKFASFDPNIGQVYTTFDGHAARGNFGLKRPLALRRRNAHITVQAIDSREQQTVWRSAEPQNRWIRMWDETGTTPTIIEGSWQARLGPHGEFRFKVDSDLVPQEEDSKSQEKDEEGQVPISNATRNMSAMSNKEFEWYLRRIRELRPAFREFLNKKYPPKDDESELDRSLLSRSLRSSTNDVKEFLAHRAYLEYREPRPRHIEQQPHRYAGLNYTRSPPLQTQLNTKAHVGRVLGDEPYKNHVLVATVGMTSEFKVERFEDDAPAVSTFRFSEVVLSAAPATVGEKPEGLEGVKMRTTLRESSEESRATKNNPHHPGSKAYITHPAATTPTLAMARPVDTAVYKGEMTRSEASRYLLRTLRIITPTGESR
ncbi:hypothetical protein BN946_scf185014.g128 [Trametes cinnabarina]|uniref:Uncharacterized protein n=1 Tax=Pycnoporus cinnabarinus TaxID=5643 RepID=A0A060SMK8_PYCCI|nr:hypothetical protein BN946_scf185014.g128 [Trametes cinnabarina]